MAQEAVVVQPAGQQAIAADALLVQRALVVERANRQADVLATGVAFVTIPTAQTGHWHCEQTEILYNMCANETRNCLITKLICAHSHLTHSTSELPVKPGGQLHCLI